MVCFTPHHSSWFICVQMWGRRVLPAALPALFSATLSLALSVCLCVNVGPRGATHPLPAPFSATLSLALSVYLRECGAAGSASGQTACPVGPTLCQSQSCHSNASPLHPGCPSPPLLPVWMNVYFLFPWCRNSLLFDFLSVLVVRGSQCVYLHCHLGSPCSVFIWF